jgi:hypothetical protein
MKVLRTPRDAREQALDEVYASEHGGRPQAAHCRAEFLATYSSQKQVSPNSCAAPPKAHA